MAIVKRGLKQGRDDLFTKTCRITRKAYRVQKLLREKQGAPCNRLIYKFRITQEQKEINVNVYNI